MKNDSDSIINLKNSRLITDILAESMIINEKIYEPFFMPFEYLGHIFPPIDPIFKGLLVEKEYTKTLAREFKIKLKEYPANPFVYLNSTENNPKQLAFSANEIMCYFLLNQDAFAEKNFFILDTKPNESKHEDYRIVDIRLVKSIGNIKKYFLYCYRYDHWDILGRNFTSGKLKFFIPKI